MHSVYLTSYTRIKFIKHILSVASPGSGSRGSQNYMKHFCRTWNDAK